MDTNFISGHVMPFFYPGLQDLRVEVTWVTNNSFLIKVVAYAYVLIELNLILRRNLTEGQTSAE